jgi:predicted polyphosphate/ATP-dependent NAD kinase
MRRTCADVTVITVAGDMGSTAAPDARVLDLDINTRTSAQDTRAAVAALLDCDIDLLLFAGGDGTARDVAEAARGEVPILGVPTGVKMRSAVFARSPESAGVIAGRFVSGVRRTREVEIADAPAEHGDDWSVLEFFGTVLMPDHPELSQPLKASRSVDHEANLRALVADLAQSLDQDTLHIFGPGSTATAIIKSASGSGTVTGVDVSLGANLVALDVTEDTLLELLRLHERAHLYLGVVGGQGFLLGRGNQQLSPEVIEAVGEQNVTILAARSKIDSLSPPVLWVDAGTTAPAAPLVGHRRVHTGVAHSIVMRVQSAASVHSEEEPHVTA